MPERERHDADGWPRPFIRLTGTPPHAQGSLENRRRPPTTPRAGADSPRPSGRLLAPPPGPPLVATVMFTRLAGGPPPGHVPADLPFRILAAPPHLPLVAAIFIRRTGASPGAQGSTRHPIPHPRHPIRPPSPLDRRGPGSPLHRNGEGPGVRTPSRRVCRQPGHRNGERPGVRSHITTKRARPPLAGPPGHSNVERPLKARGGLGLSRCPGTRPRAGRSCCHSRAR